MNNKKITELPLLSTPSLSGVTVVVQNGITYGSTLESIAPLFSGMTEAGSSGTSGTSGSDNALPYSAVQDRKDYTGFINHNNMTVTYDWTGRTITLTSSSIEYYWRGVKYTLSSPWTSSSHDATSGNWYLYSTDGINFNWSQVIWSFTDVMVAAVYYRTTPENTFGIRETHGLMDADSHEEFHRTIGTYLLSGCDVESNSYTGNTPTDDANTPSFFPGIIVDEDIRTSISRWSENSYTLMYVSDTGATTDRNRFIFNSPLPFSATTNTYVQINDTATGQLVEGEHNRYYNIYQILFPVTADEISQQYRMVFLQPQTAHTSLAGARSENPKSLTTGALSTLSAEYLIYTRLTYYTSSGYTNTGRCVIPTDGVSYVSGSRANQYVENINTVTINNGGIYRVLTSDIDDNNILGNPNLMFNGLSLILSGSTYQFLINPETFNIREDTNDRTVISPSHITLIDENKYGYYHPNYLSVENYGDYSFLGGVGVNGQEFWIQSNAYDSAVDPHDGVGFIIKDNNDNYATIFGIESYTGWTDGHITFYRKILGLSGMTISGNTEINGNVNITGQYLINNSPIENITSVIYSELVSLIGLSGLTPGMNYRITDYRTVHYMMDGTVNEYNFLDPLAIEDAINIGDLEPLIVLATSVNTLSPIAYTEAYPYDVIHYDWNPDNWLTDISFGGNNETIVEGFKGVIYFRHDTLHDNYVGYDFRKVKFRRWNDGSEVGDTWMSEYQGLYSTASGVTDSEDYIDVLTFNCPGGEEQYNNEILSVHIESFKDRSDIGYTTYSLLNNNVFHLEADYGWYQVVSINIAANSALNTFNGYVDTVMTGSYFYRNKIGAYFYDNKIAGSFWANIIGKQFGINYIGEFFSKNVIGDDFSYNTISARFNYAIIGDDFRRNTVNNGFGYGSSPTYDRHNIIGNNVHDCTFGSSLWYSTIGDDCYNLTIGNGCQHIKINDGCHNINIDNGCSSITGGTSSSGLTFANGCTNIMIGEQSRTNTFEPNCGTLILPSSSSLNHFMGSVVNVDFTQGGVVEVENTSIIHQIGGNGNIYQTYINSGGTMTITTNTIGVYA